MQAPKHNDLAATRRSTSDLDYFMAMSPEQLRDARARIQQEQDVAQRQLDRTISMLAAVSIVEAMNDPATLFYEGEADDAEPAIAAVVD